MNRTQAQMEEEHTRDLQGSEREADDMTINEFIEARVTEDEDNAACDGVESDGHGMCYYWSERRARDVDAQRKLLEIHYPVHSLLGGDPLWCGAEIDGDYPCDTLRALASTWRDHEDYDKAWAL